MKRRNFLKMIGAGSLAHGLPLSFGLHAAPADYTGKLLIVLQANGGWDVTSFCDPKVNVSGEEPINNWAYEGEVESVGNIQYAPFANNRSFFQKYYQDMLVINGIDVQTNSHDAGHVHTFSGRLSEGFPTLSSLFASVQGPDLSMSYLSSPGAFSATGDLIRFTQLANTDRLLNVIFPNSVEWSDDLNWLRTDDWESIMQARNARLDALKSAAGATSLQTKNRSNYQRAINNSGSLSNFERALRQAGDLYNSEPDNRLKRQIQLALIAMNSGVTCAADVVQIGFDSHDNHDEEQTLALDRLTSGIDYLWTYAEQLGLADRLVLVVASDMGRTPWYNAGQGKDHWPVTSLIVMERGQSWTNRTVGLTDEGHFTVPINGTTFEADQNGSIIYPKDVMQSLRDYLGISQHQNAVQFAFDTPANYPFFI